MKQTKMLLKVARLIIMASFLVFLIQVLLLTQGPRTLLEINLFSRAPSCVTNSMEKFLPHLKCENMNGTEYGKIRSDLKYLLGIPTVKRMGENYLSETLNSIFTAERSELNFGVVIYIGDNDENYVKDLTNSLESQFPSAFLDEKIVVLSPPENFYPNFTEEIEKIQETKTIYDSFKDEPKRMKWRMKVKFLKIFSYNFRNSLKGGSIRCIRVKSRT